MKSRSNPWTLVLIFFAFLVSIQAQEGENIKDGKDLINTSENTMTTYLIERDLPGAGEFTAAQLSGISKKSCDVIEEIGPGIKWLHSYVTENKVYCLYQADDVEKLKIHAEKGGFPITAITELASTIGPKTAVE